MEAFYTHVISAPSLHRASTDALIPPSPVKKKLLLRNQVATSPASRFAPPASEKQFTDAAMGVVPTNTSQRLGKESIQLLGRGV